MRLAREVGEKKGVSEVAALMGTPANHEILLQAGLAEESEVEAGPNDLVLAVEADSQELAHEAIEEAKAFLTQARSEGDGGASDFSPSSLAGALAGAPDSNLAMISVPGAHAAKEAMDALRSGLHVFLFSDNVSVDDEVALKREAIRARFAPDGSRLRNGVHRGRRPRIHECGEAGARGLHRRFGHGLTGGGRTTRRSGGGDFPRHRGGRARPVRRSGRADDAPRARFPVE